MEAFYGKCGCKYGCFSSTVYQSLQFCVVGLFEYVTCYLAIIYMKESYEAENNC